MKMPNIALYLVTGLTCVDTTAFQLGQLTGHSRLGEPLDARVALYGLPPTASATTTPAIAVKPAIGLPPHSGARRAAEAISATLARDVNGTPFLALRSSAPVTETSFDFRLLVTVGAETLIAHYTIALDPLDRARSTVSASRTRPAAAPSPMTGGTPAPPNVARIAVAADGDARYGPVRPGQSLWRILRELGLNQGDREAVIERIVSTNPHAFVDGNADRLRVGVMLDLPALAAGAKTAATQAQTAAARPGPPAVTDRRSASRTQPPTMATEQDQDAAAMAARLPALSAKFADIRARYGAQADAGASVPAPPATPAVTSDTAGAVQTRIAAADLARADAADAAPPGAKTQVEPDLAAIAPAPTLATSLSTYIVLGAGALVSGLALIGGILMATRAGRRKRLQGHARTAEQALVAEITRKTEKRLLLEDSVKRRMSQNRQAPAAAAGGTHEANLHEVDHRIAHGQYAEARALLGNVITAAPDNFRAKLRLAEICYLDEDRSAFVAIAEDIYRQHRAEIGDDDWQRVMRMGRVLAPDQPPFSGPVALGRRAAGRTQGANNGAI